MRYHSLPGSEQSAFPEALLASRVVPRILSGGKGNAKADGVGNHLSAVSRKQSPPVPGNSRPPLGRIPRTPLGDCCPGYGTRQSERRKCGLPVEPDPISQSEKACLIRSVSDGGCGGIAFEFLPLQSRQGQGNYHCPENRGIYSR